MKQPSVHGLIFVLLLAASWAVPAFRHWPWFWLVPLAAYFLLAACVPRLHQSMAWLRPGNITLRDLAATFGITACTAVALVSSQSLARPELQPYAAMLPLRALRSVILGGAVFAIVNAISEELVFRGILFEALLSEWGPRVALALTTLLFALGHLRGYPPGLVGAALAAVFGLLMGILRLRTGGLLLPILAHIGADASIYIIVASSAVS